MKTTQIIFKNKELIVHSEKPGNILEIITQAGIEIDAPCAGIGRCGKCKVITQGDLTPDSVEKAILSEQEINAGIRLACRKRTIPDNLVVILTSEYEQPIFTTSVVQSVDIGIAIDLGTTSIAIAFINLSDGTIMTVHSILNPQRIYGADVISRIKSAINTNVLNSMTQLTINAITKEIKRMLSSTGIEITNIKLIYIAGNTVMEHIIAGKDVSSLAKAPYKPLFTDVEPLPALRDSLGIKNIDVSLFPIIGGFVGGDTVASILASNMDISSEYIALIDIGTNAEIAIGNKSGIIASSAPAGPAFEGGQIIHGMRAQHGAIEDIRILDDEIKLYVKDDIEPEGICGSGLIRIVTELLKAGVINPSGELLEPENVGTNLSIKIVKKGNEQAFVLYKSFNREIALYQSDVRALQLAKASISTGFELLIQHAIEKPEKLYIAGAFGNYLIPDDLVYIGMIPSFLKDKAYFIGDSVILGLKRFIVNEPKVNMDTLLSSIKHIELANEPSFNKVFLSMLELSPQNG